MRVAIEITAPVDVAALKRACGALIERHAFYARAREAFAVVATGERPSRRHP